MNTRNQSPEQFLPWGASSAWVAAGGVLGTLARYGMDHVFPPPQIAHPGFPWTTFAINVSGAALLGFIMACVEENRRLPLWIKPFAAVGFCGAYTTFSTASVEILILARSGLHASATAYLVASLVCGILAVALTTALGVYLCGAENPGRPGARP